MVFKQYRRVEVAGYSLADFDVEVEVTHGDDHDAEITVMNLTQSTWEQIKKDEQAVIELGWENGPKETVLFGKVVETEMSVDSRDKEYSIYAADESSRALRGYMSYTWQNREPHQIAQDIARTAGLTPRVQPVGQEISGYYSVTREQRLKHWLDELVDYAQEFTDVEWEWYTTKGRLHFETRDRAIFSAPKLTYDTTLMQVNQKEDVEEESAVPLEFTSLMEPALQKGAKVVVETDDHNGLYKVKKVTMTSSSLSGDHEVEGTLTPIEKEYRIE